MKTIELKEYKILKQLNHPNIIKIHEVYFNDGNDTMYLVMDYIEGFSLQQFAKKSKIDE